jgi:multiple antibiotic resistance protein
MFEHVLKDAITLWATIDPIATVPIFLAVTRQQTAAARRRIALRAVVISAVILLAFIVVGQLLLEDLGIQLTSFQIAGGVILFIFGLRMIFETEQEQSSHSAPTESGFDPAVFPLAMPSIASPAAIMAVVVLTDNHRFSLRHQAVTTGVMLVIMAITFVFLLAAGRIHRLIGETGAQIVIRVMGLILSALAVEMVVGGIKAAWAMK